MASPLISDVELWHLLASDCSLEALYAHPHVTCAAIEGIAELPIEQRIPFLDPLLRLAAHPSSEIRVAVLRVMIGCSGWRIREHLIAALDDAENEVRATAVSAIMRCPANVALMAHAIFHPREDVRVGAIERIFREPGRSASAIISGLPIYLLADPLLRTTVLTAIERDPMGGLSPSLIYDFHRHALIDEAIARNVILHTAPHELERELADELARSTNSPPAFLHWLVSCFWPTPQEHTVAPDEMTSALYPQGIFGFLSELLRNERCAGLYSKLFWPCYELAKSTRQWSHRAIDAMVFGDIEFLNLHLSPQITKPMLRRAFRVYFRLGREATELPRSEFTRLILGRHCLRESGQLDLWILGALLHRRRKDGFELLTRLHDPDTLVADFWDNPEDATFLFAHSEPSKERDSLLRQIVAFNPSHPAAIALLLLTLPADAEAELQACSSEESIAILRTLERLTRHDEWRLSSKRNRAIAQHFASKWFANEPRDEAAFCEFLNGWLGQRWQRSDSPAPVNSPAPVSSPERIAELTQFPLGSELLTVVAQSMPSDELVTLITRNLPATTLENLVEVFSYLAGLPYSFELALAEHFRDHESETLREWAVDRIAASTSISRGTHRDDETAIGEPSDRPLDARPLSDEDVKRIKTAAPHHLEDALHPARQDRCTRVAEALSLRPEPTLHEECLAACVALLACSDPETVVLETLDRFLGDQESMVDEITELLLPIADARGVDSIGCVWLHRWEKYAFKFGDDELVDSKSVITWLHLAMNAQSRILSSELFAGIARVLAIWTARCRPRAAELYDHELTSLLVEQLVGPHGEIAAWMLARAAKANFATVIDEATIQHITDLIPGLSESVREVLDQWIDVDAFGSIKVVARVPTFACRPVKATEQLDAFDLDSLSTGLCSSRMAVVNDAIQKLLPFGRAGLTRLLNALATSPPPAHASTIADSVHTWPKRFFEIVFDEIQKDGLIVDWLRFVVAINLIEAIDASAEQVEQSPENGMGDPFRRQIQDWLTHLLLVPCSESWFQAIDRDRWWAVVPEDDRDAVQLRMVFASHPYLYVQAVEHLIETLDAIDKAERDKAEQDKDAANPVARQRHDCLVSFLKLGVDRDRGLRARVAEALHRRGDELGYPLMIAAAVQAGFEEGPGPAIQSLLCPLVSVGVKSLLCAGEAVAREEWVLQLVKRRSNEPAMQDAIATVLADAVSESVRRSVAVYIRKEIGRQNKLRRVAESFRRGIATGRELTGRLFTIEMIGGSEFGYTRLTENRIYVNPMPLLANVPHADDIVDGLILHELGHHLYHRGAEANRVWERANDEGLAKLLNLVADEHLERNLRAMDKRYGVQLTRLAVHAFNRSAKDYPLESVLSLLGGDAFAILSQNPPAVARDPASVRVRGGGVLLALDKAGQSFPRFFRALRLGLGDRTGDAKVSAALQLFGKQFRHSNMEQLYQVTLELRKIFGDDSNLLNWLCSDSLLFDEEGDLIWQGEGITSAEVHREVERITRPPRSRDKNDKGTLCINVGSEEDFDQITQIDRLPYLADAYQAYVPPVANAARQLRRFFNDLGVVQVPVYRRTRGRLLDRSRLPGLVIHRDPRVLISREFRRLNDLFLAVAIDCSGSMQVDDNIEKAKMFAALMAESCRGLGGVDLRLFGFRHDVIHDAGDADRPAIASLEAGGGNNDAAALWHASQLALTSSRKSKVLVMISDGLPTECTTTALRSLVTRLSKRGVCCAQVAVRPISEVCFPHYVELSETDLPSAVRRFGSIVAKLVESTFR